MENISTMFPLETRRIGVSQKDGLQGISGAKFRFCKCPVKSPSVLFSRIPRPQFHGNSWLMLRATW